MITSTFLYFIKKRKLEEKFGKNSLIVHKYINKKRVQRLQNLRIICGIIWGSMAACLIVLFSLGMLLASAESNIAMVLGLVMMCIAGLLKIIILDAVKYQYEDFAEELEVLKEKSPILNELWIALMHE